MGQIRPRTEFTADGFITEEYYEKDMVLATTVLSAMEVIISNSRAPEVGLYTSTRWSPGTY